MDLHGVRNFNNSLHFIGSLGCTEVFQDTIVFHDLRELNGLWYGYEKTALTRSGQLFIFGNPGFLAELVQETALKRIQVRRIQLPSALPVSSFFAVDKDDYYISAWSNQTVESYFWRRKENELINYDLPNLREFGALRVTGLWSSSDKLFAISHPQLFIESFSDTTDRKYILYTKYMEAGRPEIAPIAIDGRANNDVFFCGSRGTIGHYNGKTIKFYYELQDKIQNIVLRDIKVSEGKVFAVGSGALSGRISAVLVVGTKY